MEGGQDLGVWGFLGFINRPWKVLGAQRGARAAFINNFWKSGLEIPFVVFNLSPPGE